MTARFLPTSTADTVTVYILDSDEQRRNGWPRSKPTAIYRLIGG